jgi:hypothetical protein
MTRRVTISIPDDLADALDELKGQGDAFNVSAVCSRALEAVVEQTPAGLLLLEPKAPRAAALVEPAIELMRAATRYFNTQSDHIRGNL